MRTQQELEGQLRVVLRDTLDREAGPHPRWPESPAARRVVQVERWRRRRWPLRLLGVAALITLGAGAGLVGSMLNRSPDVLRSAANGWIAFSVEQEEPAGAGPDTDIWFVALDHEPSRVIGTDTDGVDQLCRPSRRTVAVSRTGRWRPATSTVQRKTGTPRSWWPM